MKRFFFVFAFWWVFMGQGYAQLQVSPSNATAVIQSLDGPGVTISNININCANAAMGNFNGVNSNIGIASGVIMTTGSANQAIGPNSLFPAAAINNRPGDADLSTFFGIPLNSMYDACAVTFNLSSINDKITFNFVFGSEEYPDYVGSSFNDCFALLVQGPGLPAGWNNVAKIPFTNVQVSINNVNHISNSNFYVNNAFGSTVSYNGFTEIIGVSVSVIPNETYQFKFAIADVVDAIYDSGVFIDLLKSIPLPIQLNRLQAERVTSGIRVSWQADCAANTLGEYYVERADKSGQYFTRLSGSGRAVCAQTLEYTDLTALADETYLYRITAVEPTGEISYSNVVEVLPQNIDPLQTTWQLFPNPAQGELYLQGITTGALQAELIDIWGRTIAKQDFSGSQNNFYNLSTWTQNLPQGLYTIRVTTNHKAQNLPLVKN